MLYMIDATQDDIRQTLASGVRWYHSADFDVEEGEVPEDGELPEEALQQSKRGRFEHNNHHKPFRYSVSVQRMT